MPIPTHETFDFDKLTYAPQITQNAHGGRRADIWYGTPDTQDVQRLVAAYVAKLKQKKDKATLKKILR